MSVKLLAIQSERPKTWQVKLEIDGRIVAYSFTREDFQLGGKVAFGISSESAFRQIFRFNHPMLKRITDLIMSVAQGESPHLPIDLGEFVIQPQTSVVGQNTLQSSP